MKRKNIIVLLLMIAAIFLSVSLYRYLTIPDGKTVESREKLLSGIPKGSEWNIATEVTVKDYIISSIYSNNGRSGIAVFKPEGNGRYKLSSSEWRGKDQIIITRDIIDGEWYHIVWFNGAQTEYAEISYTIGDVKQETIKHISTNMEIFVGKSPDENHSMSVVYYDENGNRYE